MVLVSKLENGVGDKSGESIEAEFMILLAMDRWLMEQTSPRVETVSAAFL